MQYFPVKFPNCR